MYPDATPVLKPEKALLQRGCVTPCTQALYYKYQMRSLIFVISKKLPNIDK
jgi:hypothetical protein